MLSTPFYPTPSEQLSGIIPSLTPLDGRALRAIGMSVDPSTADIRLTKQARAVAREIVWQRIQNDPVFFILDSRFVTTLDNTERYDCVSCRQVVAGNWLTKCPVCASRVVRRDPNQPFPLSFIHLRDLVRFLMREMFVPVPKSRRMLITELICAWCLCNAMFRKGCLVVFQADNEEKANYNVSRVHGMWSRLPDWIKRRRPANPHRDGEEIEGKFLLPSMQSKVISIPSKPTKIRMLGPSIYFCDEAAYVPDAFENFGSVKPALQAGCQGIWASTAAEGFFKALCLDELDVYA